MAKPNKLVLVVLALLLLAGVVLVLIVPSMRGGGSGGAPAASTGTPQTPAAGGAAPAGASATAAAGDARAPLRPRPEHSAAERAAMLAAITRAREAREQRTVGSAHTPGAPASAGGDSPGTTLDIQDRTGDTSEWSKRALGTINHMLGQCYDLGLAEDGALAGTVTLRFKLVGEPGVGGVLERVEIVETSTTISQQTIRDCFTEQLHALELDPPPDGVTVERELSLRVP